MVATVQGLESLRRKLRRMPEQARVRIREALEKGGDDVVRAQKALAARSRRSGDLLDGIHHEDGDHDLQVKVISSAFYSMHVEFGTEHSAAAPFFFPGYRLVRKRVRSRISAAVSRAAREVSSGK